MPLRQGNQHALSTLPFQFAYDFPRVGVLPESAADGFDTYIGKKTQGAGPQPIAIPERLKGFQSDQDVYVRNVEGRRAHRTTGDQRSSGACPALRDTALLRRTHMAVPVGDEVAQSPGQIGHT